MTTVPVRRHNHVRRLASDRVFDGVLYTIAAILTLTALYPMYFIIIASISDPSLVAQGKILLLPRGVTLEGYEHLASMKNLWVGYGNTILYTIAGTAIMLVVNIPVAYALSRRDLVGRRWFTLFFVFPMFFGGGLIPTYLLISNLGMLDTIWAILIPGAFSVWNMIIARTYYMGIPHDMQEAAEIDGASEMVYFFKILLPLCMPIIATIAMWQFVGMWNSYFDAMIYLNDAAKQPLQLVLRAILIQSQPEPGMVSDMQSTAARAQLAELLKYATIIISSVPLMILYPFFQKYFDSGIMAVAVKG